MSETSLPSFVQWPSFPFEGKLRIKQLDEPVAVEPPRRGEDKADCAKCQTPDSAYIWVNDNWRVRSMDRPSGLPMVLILESRSHLDLGDLPNMLAAELGVMSVRLERAIRSLEGVARVHVNRWGDGAAHLHVWFMARPYGRLQLRGTFLTLWDEILPPASEAQWRENLALIAAWLAEFGGTPLAEPPHINWQAPASFEQLVPAPVPAPGEPAGNRSSTAPHNGGGHSGGEEPAATHGVAAQDDALAGGRMSQPDGSASPASPAGPAAGAPREDDNAAPVSPGGADPRE